MNTATLSQLLNTDLSYNPEGKAKLLREAAKVLRALAKEMGVNGTVYKNKAGIACSGEVTLRAGGLMVEISQFFGGKQVLFRDESNGVNAARNQYCLASELKDPNIQEKMKAFV